MENLMQFAVIVRYLVNAAAGCNSAFDFRLSLLTETKNFDFRNSGLFS